MNQVIAAAVRRVRHQRFSSRPAWETRGLSLITGSVPSQGRQREGPDLPFISQVLLALLLGPLQRSPA